MSSCAWPDGCDAPKAGLFLCNKHLEVIGVMATRGERNWTAHVVISSEHAGLRPHFQQLENQMYHALAVIDDPRDVVLYLRYLQASSAAWLDSCTTDGARK